MEQPAPWEVPSSGLGKLSRSSALGLGGPPGILSMPGKGRDNMEAPGLPLMVNGASQKGSSKDWLSPTLGHNGKGSLGKPPGPVQSTRVDGYGQQVAKPSLAVGRVETNGHHGHQDNFWHSGPGNRGMFAANGHGSDESELQGERKTSSSNKIGPGIMAFDSPRWTWSGSDASEWHYGGGWRSQEPDAHAPGPPVQGNFSLFNHDSSSNNMMPMHIGAPNWFQDSNAPMKIGGPLSLPFAKHSDVAEIKIGSAALGDGGRVDLSQVFSGNGLCGSPLAEGLHTDPQSKSQKGAETMQAMPVAPSHWEDGQCRWHRSAETVGIISDDGHVFTKTAGPRRSRVSNRGAKVELASICMVFDSSLRCGGVHRYCYEIMDGELGAADGAGFVFDSKVRRNNIQRMRSVFLNQRGRICLRNNQQVTKLQVQLPPLTVGVCLDLLIDLDALIARFNVSNAQGTIGGSADVSLEGLFDIGVSIDELRSGFFCAVVTGSITIGLR